MAVDDRSYGTLEGVGALVPKWSGTEGNFADSVRPNEITAERWIDQVSSLVNSVLAQNGFTIPVTQADVELACSTFVEQEIADIVSGINGAGRFGPNAKQMQRTSRYALLVEDVTNFIEGNAAGFEELGAARADAASSGILFRDTDESGDATAPIFQREAFGNVFQDWDS